MARKYLKSQTLRSLKAVSLIAAIALASCASSLKAPSSAPNLASQSEQAANPNAPAAKEVAPRPQLIKSAEISLQVKSIEESTKAVSALIKQQQGDILELNDFRSGNSGIAQSVFLKLRVPQEKLDAVVEAIAQLGIVKGRSLKAEDVSNQLVDLQARLKNLRQTEVQLQGILQQTGSVGDVLKVTQELSRVREAIEQIEAQLTNLKNQVAYSTIQVTLGSEIALIQPQSDLGTQLQNTWNSATNSLTVVSVGLLKLSIWLLVYCPYWLVPLAIYLFLRRRRRLLAQAARTDSNVSSD
jgi:myosin heavy subunit